MVGEGRDDDGPVWRPWVRRLPVPARWGLVLLALLVTAGLIGLLDVDGWLDERPGVARLLAGALGLAGLGLGLGPRRWLDAEARRARGDLRPGTRALGKLPPAAQRAFCIGAGALILAVALFA